jgi:dihydropteroate synthase
MAIGNITPDSFYASSRLQTEADIRRWAQESLDSGASILDIGGCSTRPGSEAVSESEEWSRVQRALTVLKTFFPDARLSLDTFRAEIARRALEEFGMMTINDISGGNEAMYSIVRAYHAPYIWTLRGDLELPSKRPEMLEMDVILDPGFGFIGSTEGDYACMRRMDVLRAYGRPILIGISRKSMVYRPLGLSPESCLSATQALQLYALEHGATILRTHDVKETKQIVVLHEWLNRN